MSADHDANFFKLFAIILAILVAFTITIAIIANMVTDVDDGVQTSKMKQKAIDERLAPIANVKVAGAASDGEAAPSTPKSGAEVVQAACFACHGTGVPGAPQIGDKAAWEPRAAAGMAALMNSALNGKGAAMPAKGGNPSLSDEEVKAAVMDMLKEAGIEMAAGDAGPAAAPSSTPAAPEASAPVVATAPVAASAPAVDTGKGMETYTRSCATCHGTGIAGAPKVGDAALWSARIAQGDDMLYEHALKGFQGSTGYMPAKGGFTFLSDDDVKAAVDYMVSESQ